MSRERSGQTRHEIPWDVVERTAVEVDGVLLKLTANEGKLQLNQGELPVGRFAQAHQHGIIVKLTPGAQKYLEARTFHQRALDDADLVAAAILAAITGHPDAEQARAGTELSAVWSQHLAIAGGDDPRQVTRTFAPSETRTTARRIQELAVGSVRILREGAAS